MRAAADWGCRDKKKKKQPLNRIKYCTFKTPLLSCSSSNNQIASSLTKEHLLRSSPLCALASVAFCSSWLYNLFSAYIDKALRNALQKQVRGRERGVNSQTLCVALNSITLITFYLSHHMHVPNLCELTAHTFRSAL